MDSRGVKSRKTGINPYQRLFATASRFTKAQFHETPRFYVLLALQPMSGWELIKMVGYNVTFPL